MSFQVANQGEDLSITLPPKMDTHFYRVHNSDLSATTDEQLIAFEKIRQSNGAYNDSRLTPSICRENIEALYQLGVSQLRLLRVYDTTGDQNKFVAVLGRGG